MLTRCTLCGGNSTRRREAGEGVAFDYTERRDKAAAVVFKFGKSTENF